MYGHKQILSCLAIVILVSIFNFYRSVIKRDKEHRLWREQHLRDQQLQQLLDLQQKAILKIQKDNHNAFLSRWLEYDDHCCDLHALVFRPRDYAKWNIRNSDVKEEITKVNQTEKNISAIGKIPEVVNQFPEMPSCEFVKSPKQSDLHVQDKVAGDLSTKIIYVAVFVLLVSLGKAAYDWSKQFKEVSVKKR